MSDPPWFGAAISWAAAREIETKPPKAEDPSSSSPPPFERQLGPMAAKKGKSEEGRGGGGLGLAASFNYEGSMEGPMLLGAYPACKSCKSKKVRVGCVCCWLFVLLVVIKTQGGKEGNVQVPRGGQKRRTERPTWSAHKY